MERELLPACFRCTTFSILIILSTEDILLLFNELNPIIALIKSFKFNLQKQNSQSCCQVRNDTYLIELKIEK